MQGPRWVRGTLLVIVAASAFVAFAAGMALVGLRAVSPESGHLSTLLPLYQQLLVALLTTAALGVAYAWIDRSGPEPAAVPEPTLAPPKSAPSPDVAAVFQQMRTYVDLEMWELALDKANDIVHRFPESREAQTVGRSINDLRWKAEPKFFVRGASEEDQRSKGLAAMLKHVKTYMDLEMWELARQKALAILKHFPDSREAAEVTPLFQQIEQRLKSPAAVPKD